MADHNYPNDATLIARGKYATLGSRKRDELKRLRESCEAITEQARVILRHGDMASDAIQFHIRMEDRVKEIGICLGEIGALNDEMEALKSTAWPKGEKE